jgi:UDP-N-acetylglucosamine--N-acetylmuramyl-(pentapeptide) pyrophosphoryl-undecaprenol N-acetylglucosamine transferase
MDDHLFGGSLVVTGGGTGGHYFPAVALAEGAVARWPVRPVVFVGARRGIEGRLLPASAWPHLLLDVEGVVGRSPWRAARSLLKLAAARARLRALWKRHRPFAVVGTGGYGAAPALLAARSLGIPYFLHESNAQPGQLVKWLAAGAAGVWCGMEAVRAHLPGARCVLAGTPVRAGFLREFSPVDGLPAPRRLLVLGGSGGARALNEAVLELAPALLDRFPDWELLHQAGQAGFDSLSGAARHPRHRLVPFLDGMDRELEAASLVITRAGASTCAELKACGRPALMVPMPGSAGNHQMVNAQAMAAEGRAQVVPQGPGLAPELAAAASLLMGEPARLAGLCRGEPNRAVQCCLDDLARLG